jgi:Cap4, dsDNA endonuclease domain
MVADPFAEILEIMSNKDISETGGGHNQKGVEFQRNWALIRMFELESNEQPDFLVLFEAVQDVTVLDSALTPTKIEIYQVKKKDRNEWSWANLTNLHTPKLGMTSRKMKPLSGVVTSPVGKLYAALRAFKQLSGTARFVSNAGCDLTMADGTNAATSMPVSMANLPPHLRDLLTESLATLHAKGEPLPDLSKIYIERVNIPVDDCATYTVGIAHTFLMTRSPSHAGQARPLVDTLLAKVGPLGAKTNSCKTTEEMRAQHGYSRSDFLAALGNLQDIPDLLQLLDIWLAQLASEGMGHIEILGIRAAAASIYRRQVMGSNLPEDKEIIDVCDIWLVDKDDPTSLLPFFAAALTELKIAFPSSNPAMLQAQFALRAIKCAVQI